MSWTKRNGMRCDYCGLFCSPKTCDEFTHFGCSSYDPPEPLDPQHVCKRCLPEYEEKWLRSLSRPLPLSGDWMKSSTERRIAESLNLAWVSQGVGNIRQSKEEYGKDGFRKPCARGWYGTENWASAYQYIPKDQFERLSALPYYGEAVTP